MTSSFSTLYPDVEPTTPLPLNVFERAAITLAVGILVFGGASGHLVITGIGAVALLVVLYLIAHSTVRRIRNEARSRFPEEDWYEDYAEQQLHLSWSTPVAWLVIIGLTAACLFLVPETHTLTAAMACALISALIVWFLPGISSRWQVQQEADDLSEEDDEDDGEEEIAENPAEHNEKAGATSTSHAMTT